MQFLSGKAAEWLEIDVRSLALFRVLLASLLLVDLAVRAPSITAHYTDAGVLPRDITYTAHWAPGFWSLHMLHGGFALQAALFGVAAIGAVLLLIGWQTRAATVLSWVMLVSLHNRNITLLNAGDDLLHALLFWAMFLPLGHAWSVDARRAPSPPPRAVLHPAGALLLLQVILVYWVVVVRRLDQPQWFERGNAVWLALMMDAYTSHVGVWVRDHATWALRPLTWIAISIEAFGPLLAFSPWRTGPWRMVAVLLFVAMHLGFGVLMEIGIFWAVSIASWTVFVPSWAWDQLGARIASLRLVVQDTRDRSAPWWVSLAAAAAMAVVLTWNARSLAPKGAPGWEATHRLDVVGNALRLDQGWNVYSPPGTNDGWFLAIGTLADGREVELRTDVSPPSFERPTDIADSYVDQRWQRFLFTMNTPRRKIVLRPYANWVAADWERRHPDAPHLTTVRLVYMACNTGKRKELPVERQELGTFAVRGRVTR